MGYTWHGESHVREPPRDEGREPLPLEKLGGGKSLKMVERYEHLNDDHVHAAAESLATGPAPIVAVQQSRETANGAANYDSPTAPPEPGSRCIVTA